MGRSGFHSATIKAVAAEVGCSTGLIYRYFSNRDELLRRTFAHASGHELDMIVAATSEAETLAELVDQYVSTFCTRAFANQLLARALLFDDVPHVVYTERLAFRADYAAVCAAGIERLSAGSGLSQDPHVLSRMIVGMVAEVLTEPLLSCEPVPASEQRRLIGLLIAAGRRILGINKERT
nr:hypothetical protein GCM10023233_06590 [Brevibacterium otitidis]